MFLYSKLVMDNLMAQGSVAELEEELNEIFPKGLDEAYERVASRVLDHPSRSPAQRRAAGQILRWLTCAIRDLKWREIQSFFGIDPHKGVCDPKNHRTDDCKHTCGSLVESYQREFKGSSVDTTDLVVGLVHNTARRYLIQSNRVNLPAANASMAIFSSAYLASFAIKNSSDTVVRENALNGYYGLLDYSASSWQEHLVLSLRQSCELSPLTVHNLQRGVLSFLQRLDFNHIPEDLGDRIESAKKFFDNACLKHCILRIESLSTPIRKAIEDIDPIVLDDRSRDVFLSLNGNQRFKCPKPRCFRFSEGFESKEARDRHVTQHYAPFTCSIESCPRERVGFLSRADLLGHTKEAHTSQTNTPTALFPTGSKPNDPLYDACARGDMQAIKGLVNTATGLRIGYKHISMAAKNDHADVCRYFALSSKDLLRGEPILESLTDAIRSSDASMFPLLVKAATPE
ncbi:uncharacterized protein PG986_011202 [Apiospora aurea]|uniref:C2H2-type domain-containing protein n=1 Tax=Apiospora aurea TaxID=335848 RepID=A0ABR1Q4G9_9PEZI